MKAIRVVDKENILATYHLPAWAVLRKLKYLESRCSILRIKNPRG